MSILLRMYPGDAWALLIVNVLVQVTVVSLAAWLLARLGSRWNAAWRHSIYLVALICVLASPLLSSIMQTTGIVLVTLRPSVPTTPPVEPTRTPSAHVQQSRPIDRPAASQITPSSAPLEAETLGQGLQHENLPSASFSEVLRAAGGAALAIWLLGMALLLARWCYGLHLIAALRRAAQPLNCEARAKLLQHVRQALGADRLPPMATSSNLDRPIMVGLIRPLVILPEDVLRTVREPELADILVHECAHAVCRHHVVGLFQRLAGMLFWPHPLVHLLNRELARAREEVCDNYVLRQSDAPRYARTLLDLSQLLVDVSPQPATLGLFHCRWTLESRVADLLDRRRKAMIRVSRWTVMAFVAAFSLLSLLIAGTRIVQAEPAAKEEPATAAPSFASSVSSTLSPAEPIKPNPRNEYAGIVYSVKFSPDGRTLASGWGDGTIKLWDVATRKNLSTLVSPKAGGNPEETILIRSVAFSPDGKTLASGNSGSTSIGMIRLWDIASGKNTASFNGYNYPFVGLPGIYCVVFSPDGKMLATGHEDHVIRLWDAASGKMAGKFEADAGDGVYSVAFSPSGKILASSGHEGTIKLWDMASGKNSRTFKAADSGNGVNSLAFSPDGKTLAAGCWMNGVELWDIASGTNMAAFKLSRADSAAMKNPNDMTYSVSFSPDGRILAQGCDNGIIALWDVNSRKKLTLLYGHTALVRSLAFAPNGKALASGGDDGKVELWGANKDTMRADERRAVKGEQPGTVITKSGDYNLYDGKLAIKVWEENQKIRWSATRPAKVTPAGTNGPETVTPNGTMSNRTPWFIFTSSSEVIWNYDGKKKINLLKFWESGNLWKEVDLVSGWPFLFPPDASVPKEVLERLPSNLRSLENATVSGKVSDESGTPVAGADVWLPLVVRGVGHVHTSHAKSDAQGRFALEVPSAWLAKMQPWDSGLTLWAYAAGHRLSTEWVTLPGGALDVVIQLGPATDTSFVVLDPEGRPCAGAFVEPYYIRTRLGFQPLPEELMARVAARTDSEGRAKLPAAARDVLFQVRITTKELGMQVQRTENSEPPAVVGGTIHLRQVGKIEGRVIASEPEIARGVRLVFTTKEYSGRSPPWVTEGHADVKSDENGRFVVPAIAVGNVRIDALVDEKQPLRPKLPESLRMQAGQTTSLEIPMVPTVAVRGSVRVKDTGKPVPGALIHIYYGVGRQGAEGVSDAQGQYTARVLPGSVRLQVISMPKGYASLHGDPSYQVPENAKEFDLPPVEVEPTKSISGRVIDEHDQPVGNIWISVVEGDRHYGRGKSDKNGQFEVVGVPATINPASVKYAWLPEVGPGRPTVSTMPSECEVLKTNPLTLRALPRDPRMDQP